MAVDSKSTHDPDSPGGWVQCGREDGACVGNQVTPLLAPREKGPRPSSGELNGCFPHLSDGTLAAPCPTCLARGTGEAHM